MNITIVGYGDIGQQLIFTLAMNKGIQNINIITESNIDGKLLDISEFLISMDLNPNKVRVNDDHILSSSKIVIITSAHKNSHSLKNRNDMYSYNLPIVLRRVREILNKGYKQKIVIITNPMEKIMCAIYKNCHIDSENLFGIGTTLDTIRYQAITGSERVLIGQHGKRLYELDINLGAVQDIVECEIMQKINERVTNICKEKQKTVLGVTGVATSLVASMLTREKKIFLLSKILKVNDLISCTSIPIEVSSEGFNNKKIKGIEKIKKEFIEEI
ncbi:hypothetical protein KU891_27770 (plasmid) [Bacillus tropicus]|uniref:lactate/malate family dehydrogenase n=1 Tax=Bacillus tropicus TaxID=2026188 RepID=UPI002003CFF9|nr:hypothetical protein [Bacillus tropicus]UOK49134.1 hypothetical protein KU891_27770 [Bacillus tropicus]